LFVTPPGYLCANSLVSDLSARTGSLAWLRIGPEDKDPATFLLSLIKSIRQFLPEFGASTLALMKRDPGPIAGWSRLYSHLAQELADELENPSTIVLEHAHLLSENQLSLAMLGNHLLAGLPDSIHFIILSHEPLPLNDFPDTTNLQGANGLRIDTRAGLSFARNARIDLPANLIYQILDLLDGRAVPLAGIFNTCRIFGSSFVQHLVSRSNDSRQLLGEIVHSWLSSSSYEDRQALAMAMDLSYIHPDLVEKVMNIHPSLVGPWIQPLVDHWSRVWCMWKKPVETELKGISPTDESLRRAAAYLTRHGAVEPGIRLYFKVKDFHGAVSTISAVAEEMLNLGQWSTIKQWLNQLPEQIICDYPSLIYIRGEISAVNNQNEAAHRSFATASRLFSSQQDSDGTCKSLLAQGALAARKGKLDQAKNCALTAKILAQSSGLVWHQGMANYLLGCLAIETDHFEESLTYFGQAANFMKNPLIAEFFSEAEMLVNRGRELVRQQAFHKQAFLVAEETEMEVRESLRLLINSRPENLPGLFSTLGWSKTPLMLKLTVPVLSSDPGEKQSFWQKLLASFAWIEHTNNARLNSPEFESLSLDTLEDPVINSRSESPDWRTGSKIEKLRSEKTRFDAEIHNPVRQNYDSTTLVVEPSGGAADEVKERISLAAYMLGPFRLTINTSTLKKVPSSRVLAVLKYLLSNHEQRIPREVLMDTFWRDSDPESARNSLNVSLHSLRQALRTITRGPVVIFEQGNYFFNPEIRIWIDYEEFERHRQAGLKLETKGLLSAAIDEYEVATSLYQGDYLEEDLYEDWPVVTRERLRVACLDMLDRLSQIYFNQCQYAACVALCQQIIERDNCREDAHCRLMRCFSRQGQQNLALRQYQRCVEALRMELDVEPEPTTKQLAEHIRKHQPV
jgi:DNA-binding SARP family transcriptional activator